MAGALIKAAQKRMAGGTAKQPVPQAKQGGNKVMKVIKTAMAKRSMK